MKGIRHEHVMSLPVQTTTVLPALSQNFLSNLGTKL